MGSSWGAEHHRVGNQGWSNGIARLFDVKQGGRGTGRNAYNSLFTVLSGDPVHDTVYRSLRRGVMRTNNPASGCVNHKSTISRAGAHGDDSPVAMLEQNTILPYPCSSMCGTQSWVNYSHMRESIFGKMISDQLLTKKALPAFTRQHFSNTSRLTSCTLPVMPSIVPAIAALLYRMSG